MARVRTPDRGDHAGIGRYGDPVGNLCPDRTAPPTSRTIFARFAGDHQNCPQIGRQRPRDRVHQSLMRAIQAVIVQIDRDIGGDQTAREPAVPAGVKRYARAWAPYDRRRTG